MSISTQKKALRAYSKAIEHMRSCHEKASQAESAVIAECIDQLRAQEDWAAAAFNSIKDEAKAGA